MQKKRKIILNHNLIFEETVYVALAFAQTVNLSNDQTQRKS